MRGGGEGGGGIWRSIKRMSGKHQRSDRRRIRHVPWVMSPHHGETPVPRLCEVQEGSEPGGSQLQSWCGGQSQQIEGVYGVCPIPIYFFFYLSSSSLLIIHLIILLQSPISHFHIGCTMSAYVLQSVKSFVMFQGRVCHARNKGGCIRAVTAAHICYFIDFSACEYLFGLPL